MDGIVDYIAVDSLSNALAVLDKLQHRASALAIAAERGRIVPELRAVGVRHYRELIERPWRIIYRIEGARVLVLAALDGRRDLEALLLDRLASD